MAEEKKVFIYNQMGFYTGSSVADASPLESGVYIYPPNSTDKEPPELKEGEAARWNGTEWQTVQIQIDDAQVAKNKLIEFLANNPDVAALITK